MELALRQSRSKRKGSAALEHVGPVLATSLVDLPPPTPSELIEYVGKFAWDETLTRLSVLASIVANGGGPAGKLARSHTTDLFLRSDPAKMPLRGRMLWNAVSSLDTVPPAANEAAIYFLQALALVYGAETGPAPSDGEITEMLIAANDYAFEWRTGRDEDLARRERIVADTVRALGFNRSRDPARHIVRCYQMLRHPPARGATWPDDVAWEEFQREAFGMPLDEYLETLVLPVVTLSMRWGTEHASGIEPPILDPSTWWRDSLVEDARGEAFLRGLATSRADARRALDEQKRPDGLVVGPTLFYRTPFVELPDRRIVATSPAMVQEHLRGGLWGKHRAAMGKKSAEWPPAFGELFEDWCQHVALIAQPDSVDDIIVPESRGTDDEVEDVIIRKSDKVAFVSVKASTIPERTMRGAESQRAVVEWFDEFLFSTKGMLREDGQKHGGGAIQRLDAKITKLRQGLYENHGLERSLKVYPVLVTYEIGLDSPALYRWTAGRCAEESLLQHSRVEPVTFASIEDFEALLALSTRGQSAIDILRQKTSTRWREGRLDVLLHERKRDELDLRLPELTAEFDAIFARCTKRVFGREPGALPIGDPT